MTVACITSYFSINFSLYLLAICNVNIVIYSEITKFNTNIKVQEVTKQKELNYIDSIKYRRCEKEIKNYQR